MNPSLKYSHAVRQRTIDAAVMLLTKAGCEVSVTTDQATTHLTVHNPLDPTDRIGALAKQVIDCETTD